MNTTSNSSSFNVHPFVGGLKAFDETAIDQLCLLERELNYSPWTAGHFKESLNRGHICLGYREAGQWLAYAVSSKVLDEGELLLLGVHREWQRKGLARALVQKIVETLGDGVNTLFLEVRESNLIAVDFYEAMHFNCLGSRPNYYPTSDGARENALLFALDLKK